MSPSAAAVYQHSASVSTRVKQDTVYSRSSQYIFSFCFEHLLRFALGLDDKPILIPLEGCIYCNCN